MPEEIKKKRDLWEILEVLSKFTTGFLLVVIAFVLDVGSKRIAESNEESKIIQSLIEDLTTRQAESRNDVALLSLEKYLLFREKTEAYETDKHYIIEVAGTILQQRIQEDSSVSVESSIPYRILYKYDTVKANQILTDFTTNKRASGPPMDESKPVSASILDTLRPIVQSKNAAEANVISSFNKRICYIQFNNEDQRASVKVFQDSLKSRGWIAPGTEYVAGSYPNTVKYFNEEDKPIAEKAAALANAVFKSEFHIIPIISSKFKVPKGQVEVWVNNK